MKSIYRRSMAIALCFGVLVAAAYAQNRTLSAAAGDKYVISAKAGGVNLVQGDVRVMRSDGSGGLLIKGDDLEVGDRVITGSTGMAEVLLNPGSYVRLGSNSRFAFKTTSLEDLQLEVETGKAVLEVFATKEFQVTVTTPNDKYVLIETGVYRVDVASDKTARLRVWKGRALANDSDDAIKGGRSVESTAGPDSTISKFDRDEKDDLDEWSKARSKELAKVSAGFQRGTLRTSLVQSFFGRRWDMFSSFGLWVYDPFFGSSCFLPFGYGWSSPYGYGYGSYLGWYRLPRFVYYPQPTTNPSNPTGTSVPTRGPTVSMDQTPPFQKVQRTSMGGVRGSGLDRTPPFATGRSTSLPSAGSSSSPPPRSTTSSDSGGGRMPSAPSPGEIKKP